MTRRRRDNPAPRRNPPHVAFYFRVSSDEQQERGTIETQRMYLRDRYSACFQPDAPPDTRMVLVGEYNDDGVSGSVPLADRPGGRQLLADARAGLLDIVFVYKLDRLGRTLPVSTAARDELDTYGVMIQSANEPISAQSGPERDFGRYMFNTFSNNADFERAQILRRTMDGKRRVAREGRFVNGTLTYGYDVDDDGRMVPSQRIVAALGMTESDLIRTLYERVAGGESCYALSDWLTKAGVPAPRYMYNKKLRRVTEVHIAPTWSNKRIWQALRNPAYRGRRTLSFEGDTIEQQIAPLVSEDLWQMANLRMADTNPWNRSGRRDSDKDYVYIVSKKLRCTGKLADGRDCGLFYTGGLANAIRYYRCNGNDMSAGRRRGSRCHAKMIRAELVETLLWQDIVWTVDHPDVVLAQLQEALASRNDASSTFRMRHAALLEQRDKLVKTRLAIRGLVAAAVLEASEAEHDLAANNQHLAAVDQELVEIDAVLSTDTQDAQRLADAAILLKHMRLRIADVDMTQDRAKMREIINALIAEVLVLDESRVSVRYTFGKSPAELVSTVGSLVNVKTVLTLMLSDRPQDRVRVLC